MPKNNAAATAWVPKALLNLLVVLLLVEAFVLPHPKRLQFGNHTFLVDVAQTQRARQQGLSGRKSMPANHGMLFVFQTPDKYCFWMKDMKFPLDMIWLDANKRVVNIQKDATPDTYPESFCPRVPTQYVIELNRGVVAETGLKEGDQVQF